MQQLNADVWIFKRVKCGCGMRTH